MNSASICFMVEGHTFEGGSVMIRTVVWPFAMFLVATLFYLYEFILRVAPSSMFDDLMRDFQLNGPAFGWLSSFYLLSYSALQLPVGVLTDRFGPRRLLTAAIILCAVSTLLFGLTDSFFWVCVARLFIGAGSAFAFISCMKIVATWFRPEWFALLTGATLTIGTMGAVVGQISVALALRTVPWRELMILLGLIGLVLGLFAWLIIRDRNADHPDGDLAAPGAATGRALWESLKSVLKSKQNWVVALYGFMVTAPTDALGGAWGIPYLVQAHGFERSVASSACTMTFFGLAVGSPILGWLSNHQRSRKGPALIGTLIALGASLYLIYAPTLTPIQASVLFFIFGFSSSYVLAFVIIRDILPPRLVGTAVGFVNMASMVGSTVLTSLVGYVLHAVWNGQMINGVPLYHQGAYQYGLFCMPLCYGLSLILLLFFMKESYPGHAPQ